MGLSNKIIKSISIIFAALVIAFQLQPAIALATQTCYVSGATTRFGPTPATTSSTNCSSTTAVSTSGGTVQSQNQTSQNQTSQSAPTCQTSFDPLTWLMCPIINMVADAESKLEQVVEQLLQTQPLYFSSTANCTSTTSTNTCNQMKFSAALFSVWSTFRVYGNIVLVIALLVIVIGEAVGGGVFEAYNLRKVLPRILVAAILINLSIYIVAALEDIFNILGASMQTLIETPFKAAAGSVMNCAAASGSTKITGMCIQPGAGTGAIFSLGLLALIGVAFSGVGIGVLLMVVLSGLVAALGVLVTLMLREGILVFLLIASPIAFALYVMPNTEKYFKQWWSQLIKTLMVYPVVTVVFGMAYVTSIIMGDFGLSPQALSQTFATLAMIAPLFLIPFAFRISGGVMASVSGAVSKLQRRATAPMMKQARKSFVNNFNARRDRALKSNFFKNGTTGENANLRGRMNRRIQRAAVGIKAGGANPAMWGSRTNAAITQLEAQLANENMEKNQDFKTNIMKDRDMLEAGQRFSDENEIMDFLRTRDPNADQGTLRNKATLIVGAQRAMGARNFNIAAAQARVAAGGYRDAGEMLESINSVAGSDRVLASEMLGNMRELAKGAQRPDLYGASHGTMQAAMDGLYRFNPQGARDPVQEALATHRLDEAAIREQGPAVFLSAKPEQLERLSGVLMGSINDAMISGDRQQIDYVMADVANIYDQLHTISPERAAIFAKTVMGTGLLANNSGVTQNMSVRQYIDTLRANPTEHPDYHDRRREMNTSQQALSKGGNQANPTAGGGTGAGP